MKIRKTHFALALRSWVLSALVVLGLAVGLNGCSDGPYVDQPGAASNEHPTASALNAPASPALEASPLYQAEQASLASQTNCTAHSGMFDTLEDYAAKCDVATGVHVPWFNCDLGTEVPEQGLIPAGQDSLAKCAKPNVLNGTCDPGSKFQVLAKTDDAVAVAHCRKVGHPISGSAYGDIAVIQYNKRNGAICFYQALGNLTGNAVPAPAAGISAWNWKSPAETQKIGCTSCHDNGGLIRSPYLAQATTLPNVLPSSSQGFSNLNTPLRYVGLDYASVRSWSVFVEPAPGDDADHPCNSCHRLGVSNSSLPQGNQCLLYGTAAHFANVATAPNQAAKFPHGNDLGQSPIWMRPAQITYAKAAEDSATRFRNCATSFWAGQSPGFTSGTDDPNDGCVFQPLGTPWIDPDSLPRLWAHKQIHAGGDIGHVDITDHLTNASGGTNCTPGYERYIGQARENPTLRKTGNGNCTFLGWNNANDKNDCGAVALAHSDLLFANVDCDFAVYEVKSRRALAGGMIVSDRNPALGVNAYGGAHHEGDLKLVNNCSVGLTDCAWLYRNGMLLSATNPNLAVNAYGGARHGGPLKLVDNCSADNTDCTWTYRAGMFFSDTDPGLAINAYGGAAHGTNLQLVNNCSPSNPDCTWTYRNVGLLADSDTDLSMNAYGGARHGTAVKTVNNCGSNNADCTFTYHLGMLLSDSDSGLALNAFGGARDGAVLTLVNNCTADNPDCTWTSKNGMLLSDTDANLAANAQGGVAHEAIITLVDDCRPGNPNCSWSVAR
jgi:hypothetical protein